MQSSDKHALDLLSSPKAVDVRLQRRLDFNPKSHRRPLSYAYCHMVDWERTVLSLGTAVW